VPRKNIKTVASKNIATPTRKPKPHQAKNTKALREELAKAAANKSSLATLTTNQPMLIDEDPDLEEPVVTIAENLTPSKKKDATGEPKRVIYLDIFKLNGEKYHGDVTKLEAKAIWRALRQNTAEINRINCETVQGDFVRLGYDLKHPIKVTELSSRQDFTIEVNRGIRSDIYKVRLADFQALACDIGDTVKVVVYHTGLEVNAKDIEVTFIKNFSTSSSVRAVGKNKNINHSSQNLAPCELVIGRLNLGIKTEEVAPSEPGFPLENTSVTSFFYSQDWIGKFGKIKVGATSPKADDDIGTDDWIITIVLEQHIPQVLPIGGNRAIVYYPGIPKLCKKCYESDHLAPSCNKSVDWLEYVARFLRTGLFTEPMVGRWMDALRKYHPDYNRQPNDARQQIVLNQRGVPRGDLRRRIGVSSTRDLRTNIGNNTTWEAENQYDQNVEYQYQHQGGPVQHYQQGRGAQRGTRGWQPRGRGRGNQFRGQSRGGRGRGQERGRGGRGGSNKQNFDQYYY